MRMSWKLGQVAGIDVYLHPTFFLLLLLPQVLQGGIPAALLVFAVFGCLLLHELGHALMARRFGIETDDITLSPIGGVARLRRMPKAPGAELLIALAGPAVNVLIVLALAGLYMLGTLIGLWAMLPVQEFLIVLMVANIVLVAFNLVPAFPMDGGRVLRALLSGWLGRTKATTIAAGIGRVLALTFGIYSAIHGEFFQVVLAMFIFWAASKELGMVLAEERQRSMDEGIWTAPPGFRWVSRGRGVWQLSPIVIPIHDRANHRWL